MKLGYLGLGKMGKNMVLSLLEKDHQIIAWNRSAQPRQEVSQFGATTVETIIELVQQLETPRVIWLMLPAGSVTSETITELATLLEPGDTVIDGANSFYKDSIKHSHLLQEKKINFLDCGVSGGPYGARHGACLMIGGDVNTFKSLEPLFKDIASPDAYQFFSGAGAGHFVKMVHNGIEYGMMQSIAEGFAVMKASDFDLDLEKVASIYNRQSVIESRLIGWTQSGYQQYGQELESVSTTIAHSGEGEWTVTTAQELAIPVPVIETAYNFRVQSQLNPAYTNKVVSMLRNQFGGHSVESDK